MSVADQATHPATVNTWLDSRSITDFPRQVQDPSRIIFMTPSTQIAPSSGDELLFLLLPLIPKLSTREWSLLLALAVLPYGPVAKAHGDPLSCLDMKALQYGRYTATECLEDLHTLKRLGWVEIQDGTGSWMRSQTRRTIAPFSAVPGCISTGEDFGSVRSESKQKKPKDPTAISEVQRRRAITNYNKPASAGLQPFRWRPGRMAGESRVRQAGAS